MSYRRHQHLILIDYCKYASRTDFPPFFFLYADSTLRVCGVLSGAEGTSDFICISVYEHRLIYIYMLDETEIIAERGNPSRLRNLGTVYIYIGAGA